MKKNRLYYIVWTIKIKLLYWYRKIIVKPRGNDIKEHAKAEMLFGFKNSDFSPRRCLCCGHNEFNETIRDIINYDVCEKEAHCTRCNRSNGYWSYGHWMP